ncbi:MAG: arginine N-succinyltransferase [Puniceicoccaceae bacterium]
MTPTFVIRPVVLHDLKQLIELLGTLEHSLTSMPRERSFLEKRIHRSIQSFYPGVSEPGSEQYLFVLEERSSGRLIGTAAIIARVGGYEPFFTYRIKRETYSHAPLGIHKQIRVLHLESNHDGPSELGSLYLHPEFRSAGVGRLLSLSRLLFMARFPQRFRSRVIAEFRGWVDADGRSPFWDQVGRHFFEREFDEADFLSGMGNKEFINDLMPEYPIYLPLLPESVQAIIGRVHRDTEAAVAILKHEGFAPTDAVDIFDAGPMFEAQLGELRIPRNLQQRVVRQSTDSTAETAATSTTACLISNARLEFACSIALVCNAEFQQPGEPISLTATQCNALGVRDGDAVDVVPLRDPAMKSRLPRKPKSRHV